MNGHCAARQICIDDGAVGSFASIWALWPNVGFGPDNGSQSDPVEMTFCGRSDMAASSQFSIFAAVTAESFRFRE